MDKEGSPGAQSEDGDDADTCEAGGTPAQKDGGGIEDSQPPAWCRIVPAVLLILQTVAFSMTFRVARRQGSGFSNITMVIASEVVKMLGSMLAIAIVSGPRGLATSLERLFWSEARRAIKMCVPGCLYLVQNFLYFIAISNLSICLYEVTKQLNVLTTSITWIVFLGKRIECLKWIALFLVLFGVCAVTWQGDQTIKGNFMLGITSILVACFLSSLASVFMEKMLQKEDFSLWENNVILAFFGIVFGVGVMAASELDDVVANGFTHGYTSWVWGGIVLQALGGILTAAVLKYLDSVTKVVSKATSVVLSSASSRILLQEGPRLDSPIIAFGMALTLSGITLYGLGVDWLLNLCGTSSPVYDKIEDLSEEKPSGAIVEAELVGVPHGEDSESAGEGVCQPDAQASGTLVGAE